VHPDQRPHRPHHRTSRGDRGDARKHHSSDLPVRADHVDRSPGGVVPDRGEWVHLYSVRVQGEQQWQRPVEAGAGAELQQVQQLISIADAIGQGCSRSGQVHPQLPQTFRKLVNKPQQCHQSEPAEQQQQQELQLQRLLVQDRLPDRPKKVCLHLRALGRLRLQLDAQTQQPDYLFFERPFSQTKKKTSNPLDVTTPHTPHRSHPVRNVCLDVVRLRRAAAGNGRWSGRDVRRQKNMRSPPTPHTHTQRTHNVYFGRRIIWVVLSSPRLDQPVETRQIPSLSTKKRAFLIVS